MNKDHVVIRLYSMLPVFSLPSIILDSCVSILIEAVLAFSIELETLVHEEMHVDQWCISGILEAVVLQTDHIMADMQTHLQVFLISTKLLWPVIEEEYKNNLAFS